MTLPELSTGAVEGRAVGVPIEGGASAQAEPRWFEMPCPTRRVKARGRLPGRIAFWLPVLLVCALAGVFYNEIQDRHRPLVGAIYGFFTGGAVVAFERGALVQSLRGWIRSLPTLLSVPAAEIAYVVLIMCGNAVGGTVVWGLGLQPANDFRDAVLIPPAVMLYALVVSAIVVSMIRMRDLIGAEVFGNLLLGRYYRPVQEERIFMFLDVVGSTAYARQHGDLRAQEYLGAIFAALADPVRRHRGSIDDYVGDMAIVTWPIARGTWDARCIACVFDFLERIDRDQAAWRESFGQVPRFRAALHGGAVVTAEVGVDRHKISYFGDVVNTTGRMEALCRTLDTAVLISADLMGLLPGLPDGVNVRPFGSHVVKGRGETVSVLALEAAA